MKRLISLATLVGAGLGLFLVVQTASAHSRPIRFDPPPGTVLNAAPSQVTGWFTQPIRRDPNWSFLQVTDASGTRVDAGESTFSADRKQMTVALKTGLGPGRYVVTWRTWDDGDGRIFGDCYTFFVGQEAANQALASNARLDGGGTCMRIDVSGTNGTPVPGVTPTAGPAEEDHDEDAPAHDASSDGGRSGIPVWGLAAGVVLGVVAGGVGGRYLGGRA